MKAAFLSNQTQERNVFSMADFTKRYPPYEGDEPYLYYAFCQADSDRAGVLLGQLFVRGCRIWYGSGKSRSQRLERIKNASLAVIFMSAKAMADADEVKSAALFCQSRGTPVIVIDAVENNELSTGFSAETKHVPALNNPAQLEAALIRTEGFSQKLIGQRQKAGKAPVWKAVLAAVLAAGVVGLGSAYAMGAFAPKDEVTIADSVIREAVRRSVGSPITRAAVEQLTQLHLDGMPEMLESLEELPRLERLEIPDSCVQEMAPLIDRYTIVVYGGTEK